MVVHLKTVFRLFTCICFHSCPSLYLIKMLFFHFQPRKLCKSSTLKWSPRWRPTLWRMMSYSGSGSRRIWLPWWPRPRCITGPWKGTPNLPRFLTDIPASQVVRYVKFIVFFFVLILLVFSQNYWKLNLSARFFWFPPHWKLEIMIQVQIYHSFR